MHGMYHDTHLIYGIIYFADSLKFCAVVVGREISDACKALDVNGVGHGAHRCDGDGPSEESAHGWKMALKCATRGSPQGNEGHAMRDL